MTQEELDAMMSGEIDDIDGLEFEDVPEESAEATKDAEGEDIPLGYNEETSHHWPLPATDENKMVHQLDDVTKESEEKASEIFDIIEGISTQMMDRE